ncbi:Cytochrome c-type biogenesis protein CcmH precursor, partial [Haemophilus influenzae]
IKKYHSRKIT